MKEVDQPLLMNVTEVSVKKKSDNEFKFIIRMMLQCSLRNVDIIFSKHYFVKVLFCLICGILIFASMTLDTRLSRSTVDNTL